MVRNARLRWPLRSTVVWSAALVATTGLVAIGGSATAGAPARSAPSSQAPPTAGLPPHAPLVAPPGTPSQAAIPDSLVNQQGSSYVLEALTGTSADDVWVGGIAYTGSTAAMLTLHYDGTRWTKVPTPGGLQWPALLDIAAIAPDDVWAVGNQYTAGGAGTENLAMHWDGTSWATVPTPDPSGQYLGLSSVSTVSSNQVYASGRVCETGEGPCAAEVLRWSGTVWRVVTKPPVSQIYRVSASAPTDAFGIGEKANHAYSAHWNGNRWRSLELPSTQYGERMYDVSDGGAHAAWAVGARLDNQGYAAGAYVVRRSNSKWQRVTPAGEGTSYLDTVSADAADDAWISGGADLEHWDGTAFHEVSSPLQRQPNAGISDVAAFAPDDAWMIGQYSGPNGTVREILHYDGSRWSVSRSFGQTRTTANSDVDALSRTDAWLVGNTQTTLYNGRSQISHWDGTSWKEVAHPSPGTVGSWLGGVDAQSTTDVWSVGAELTGDYTENALIEHWDGSAWSVVDSQSRPVDQSYLRAVSADSSNDAWAVGGSETRYGKQVKALAEHWDGKSWQLARLPNGVRELTAVSTVSRSDAWAVGYQKTAGGPYAADVLHWDGSQWTVVERQVQSNYNGYQYASVVASSPHDVWVLGSASTYHGAEGKPESTLALHWDGVSWSQVATPTRKLPVSRFAGASTDAKGGLWAVGYEFDHIVGYERPLIEHWDGTSWMVADMQTQAPGTTLRAVSAASGDLAWAVGSKTTHALLMRWNGTIWRR